MSKSLLSISNLQVNVADHEILKGISFDVEPGKVYALMGPNGSGKSTLSYTIAGHPKYQITGGKIEFEGKDISNMSPDERAKLGIFLSFQYPKSIPGVTLTNFLRSAYKAVKDDDIRVFDFHKKLKTKMDELGMPHSFMSRFVNEGFSGGEKKKAEILQAMVLEPKLVIMDETDSGLDVDAMKVVAEGVQKLLGPNTAVILITHYFRILSYLKPDVVHILKNGELVKSGDHELAEKIEKEGFGEFGPDIIEQEGDSDPFAIID